LVNYSVEIGKLYIEKEKPAWRERLKQGLGIMADICSMFNDVLNQVHPQRDLIEAMLQTLKSTMSTGDAEEMKYFEGCISKIIGK